MQDPAADHAQFMDAKSRINDLILDAEEKEREARETMKAFRSDVAKGRYEWDEQDIREFLNTSAGGYLITWILMRGDDVQRPLMTQETISAWYNAGIAQAKLIHSTIQWALGFLVSEDVEKNVLPTPELKAAS